MKINRILLYNFNSFEGENEFDFTNRSDKKNIILIGGKNGAGKTSLFTAIKIALYGPLAFGYVGINPHYIAKIKECINSKAFQTEKVEARVELKISLMVERELKEYDIVREWDYSDLRLVENFSVRENGMILNSQELSYFQNYLQGMIPPDLFEFFLFDGEAVGNIFATSTYNKYIKNAVYTLCGLDVFELIRKYTVGYVGKSSNVDDERFISEYEKLKEKVEEIESSKEVIDQRIKEESEELEKIETELIELETAFKNAGGITKKERNKLSRDYEEAERIKSDAMVKIKIFMEGLMPFFIVKGFNEDIRNQLDTEEKRAIYQYVEEKLDRSELKSVLKGKPNKKAVDELVNVILSQFRPEGDTGTEISRFDLSREETGRVNAMMSSVDSFDVDDMISTVQARKNSMDRTAEINKILKSSMSNEDAASFAEKENGLLRKKEDVNQRVFEDKTRSEELASQLAVLIPQCDKAKQNMLDNVQSRHIYELSNGLASMMEILLSEKAVSIRRDLEDLIVANLKRIYRKNNLITHIEIDDDFQLNLYQDENYTSDELLNLINNLGKGEFSLAVGKVGEKTLYEMYGVNSMKMLLAELQKGKRDKIKLYKNIDLNRLSKGERQIFILSLYWAIIEMSGKDIPFVIDTPYARIDASHREEISKEFFPKISKQVVILSTDEEINEKYYKILKPYIAREYQLVNDENQNKSSVENKYFFGA